MDTRGGPEGDDERLVTKGDLQKSEESLRREVKLWVGIALLGGQVVAALVSSFIMGAVDPATVVQAMRFPF